MKLVFVDESGSPKIPCKDPSNPYFALTAVIFDADYYFYEAEPLIDLFKEKWFESSDHVLHSEEIKSKRSGVYSFLSNTNQRELFQKELNDLLEKLQFECSCTIINVVDFEKKYGKYAINPLLLAHYYLGERLQKDCLRLAKKTKKGRVFIEECNYPATGLTREEFLSTIREEIVLKSPNIRGYHLSIKSENLSGIQIADLCANPLRRYKAGLKASIIDPEIIKKKIIKNPLTGKAEGWGWKIFP